MIVKFMIVITMGEVTNMHFIGVSRYELQIYEVAKEISQFLNYNGKVKDGYTLRFMSY